MADAVCRYHGTPLATSLVGTPFCPTCRKNDARSTADRLMSPAYLALLARVAPEPVEPQTRD